MPTRATPSGGSCEVHSFVRDDDAEAEAFHLVDGTEEGTSTCGMPQYTMQVQCYAGLYARWHVDLLRRNLSSESTRAFGVH